MCLREIDVERLIQSYNISHVLSRKIDMEVDLSLHQSAETISSKVSSSSTLVNRDPPAADTSRALNADIDTFLGDVSIIHTSRTSYLYMLIFHFFASYSFILHQCHQECTSIYLCALTLPF